MRKTRTIKKKAPYPKCVPTGPGEMVCVMEVSGVMHWSRYEEQDGVWLLMESERMPLDIIGDYLAWAQQKFVRVVS